MEEKKMQMFGKSHNVLGSTETDLILLTKGNIKIRWGSRKFIDLIKGGKINAEGSLILNKVASLNDIKGDGIYFISETGEVLLSINGQVINLSNLGDSSYISFLVPLELTPELKQQALTNAGFYYLTLEDAQSANIQSGLVYIVNEKKLYLVENGQLTEFITQSSTEGEGEGENTQTFDELWIGDLLHIYNSDYSIIDAVTKLGLLVGSEEYIALENNQVYITKDLVSNMIKSEGATSTKGYRLYYKNGKSVLEVDDIIWRNKPEEKEDNLKRSRILDDSITFSEHDNVIIEANFAEFTESTDEEGNIVTTPIGNKVICKLKYKHKYLLNLYIYVYKQNEGKPYIILCSWEDGDTEMEVSIDPPYPEDVVVKVIFDESPKEVTIPANTSFVLEPNSDYIEGWEVIKGPSTWSDGNTITSLTLDKATPKEYQILETTDDSIIIELPENEMEMFVKSAFNSIVSVSLKPYIQIKDNNLTLLDRSTIKDGNPDETIHSLIGIIKDFKFDFNFDFNFPELFSSILSDCPSGQITWEAPLKEPEKSEIQVGIYSDNLKSIDGKLFKSKILDSKISNSKILKGKILEGEIANSTSVNSKLYSSIEYSPLIYNAVFKKGCNYPSYDTGYEIPKDSNDSTIVYSKWVKIWIDELISKINALEDKVDLNKQDSDLQDLELGNTNTNINNDISDLRTQVNTNTTNISKNSENITTNTTNISANKTEIDKLKELLSEENLKKLISELMPSLNGDANNPTILISGYLTRASGSNTRYVFNGSKKPDIGNIEGVATNESGTLIVNITSSTGKTITITSCEVVQANSGKVSGNVTTNSSGRSGGAHWFGVYHENNKIYIKEFHQINENNDSWGNLSWFYDLDVNKIEFTVFGYIQ